MKILKVLILDYDMWIKSEHLSRVRQTFLCFHNKKALNMTLVLIF